MAIKIKHIWKCESCGMEVKKPTCPDVWWLDHECRGCESYDYNQGHDWECIGEVDDEGNEHYY